MTRAEMTTPTCTSCREPKPRTEFDWRNTGALQSWCRECTRDHRRAAMAAQRRETSQILCGND
jgi:hypothetical protein